MKKQWVEIEFEIGDQVYLKTDQDQQLRIVTALSVREGARVNYELSCGITTSWHSGFEISADIDVKIKTSDR